MVGGFAKIVDFILGIIENFYFLCVIDQYERAVVLRFGKFSREIGPGLHAYWPFGIEDVYKENVVLETQDLPAQAFTTKDGVNAVASAVVTLTIKDIKKLLLEVEDAETVLTNASRGLIRNALCTRTWKELQTMGLELDDLITAAVRRPAFKWGIEVHKVQLSDLVKASTMRIIHDGTLPAGS